MSAKSKHNFEQLICEYCAGEGKDTAICRMFENAPQLMEIYYSQLKVEKDMNKLAGKKHRFNSSTDIMRKKSCSSCLTPKLGAVGADSPCSSSPVQCIVNLISIAVATDGLPPITEREVNLFLNALALPPFPSGLVGYNLEQFLLGLADRLIAYQYLPFTLIMILSVWLMVAAGWLTVAAGLILTIVFLAIIYFFFVSFRVSIKAFIESFVNTAVTTVDDYRAGISNALLRLPTAIVTLLCAMGGLIYDPQTFPPCPSQN